MFILKLSALSCAFYLGTSLILQTLLFILAQMGHIVVVRLNRLSLGVLFGLIWLASFSSAWHILYSRLSSRLSLPPH